METQTTELGSNGFSREEAYAMVRQFDTLSQEADVSRTEFSPVASVTGKSSRKQHSRGATMMFLIYVEFDVFFDTTEESVARRLCYHARRAAATMLRFVGRVLLFIADLNDP